MVEKIQIAVDERVTREGEVATPPPQELLDAMEEAGWTDDPRSGKAILLADGSEFLNPTPIAAPVDYDSSPSAFDIWQAQLQRMANIRDLGDGFLIDEEADAEDFDIDDPDDVFVRSDYEIQMVPEAPSLGRAVTPGPIAEVSPEDAKRAALQDGNVGEEVR